jgi:PTH1 family peptidyl-tRNA hydrolase
VVLVLGLGNPGERYARTRHNVGWLVLEELERRLAAREAPRGATFREWVAPFRDRTLSLVKPLTYMNESGRALDEWRERHGTADAMLVVTDDVYLPVGALRLRARGSSGGHRGLESIARALEGQEWPRLRLGVSAADGARLREHVLDEPAGDEAAALEEAIRVAADAVECWLGEGILAAMNRFNRKVHKEADET